nr:MAG TPA: hypothetical protein [Bacteriophage sp.]
MKQSTLDLIKNINENTFIPATTQNELFELFQLDTVADLRKVSRNFMKVYELLEHFDNQTSNATEEKEGIVKFGTEAGNAIDAKTWKQAIGQTLGGYVSKVENKEAGKWYINDLTDGKIYKCIQSHTSTSFDITKFVDITNVGLSDKVENLFKIEVLAATNFLGYFAGQNVTEWFVSLPSRIGIKKIISVTNLNLGSLTEYNNIDYVYNCIRMGCQGDSSNVPLAAVKVAVAYFT